MYVLEWMYYTKNMREYQHKYILRTLLYSPIMGIILFLCIVFLLRSVVELNDKRIRVAQQELEVKTKEEELRRKLAKAEERKGDIETSRGFEAYVRTTYPVVQEGEGVIVVYDNQTPLVTPVRSEMTLWEKMVVWWRNK